MKLSVIEFDYHAEVLRNTLKILDGVKVDVRVYSRRKIWEQANWQGKDLVPKTYLLEENESLSPFIRQHLSALNDSDLLLFNTLASNFKFWNSLELKAPRLLRIHNAHANFKSLREGYKPIFTPFFLWKDFSHFVRKIFREGEHHHQKGFVAKTDFYAFPDELIRNYAVQELQVRDHQAFSLPFSFWEEEDLKHLPKGTDIQISIIGKIDPRNRDYEMVLSAIRQVLPQLSKSDQHLKLCCLGKAKGAYAKKMVKAFSELENKNFGFRYFKDFIPQEKFEAEVAASQYLLIPTKAKTRFTIYEEHYGFSKISGNINDLIRYHRMALIQADYPLKRAFDPLFIKYHTSGDLADQLLALSKKPLPKPNFKELLADYNRQAMQKHYMDTFNRLIEGNKIH